jgi:hypothetical protein
MNKTNQMNQINPSRQSRSTTLQGHVLVITGLLVVDFKIPQNGFLGTC